MQAMHQEEQGLLAEAAGSDCRALLIGGPNLWAMLWPCERAAGDGRTAAGHRAVSASRGNRHRPQRRLEQPRILRGAELGSLQEAAGAFRRALEADPDNWRAHYNLADVLEELGEHAPAAHPLARARPCHDRDSEQAAYARERMRAGQ